MNKYLFLMMLAGSVLASCEKPYITETDDDPVVANPSEDDDERGEMLLSTNDTARFYLSPIEIKDVMLFDHPTPSVLIKDSRFRLPRKLEVSDVLKTPTCRLAIGRADSAYCATTTKREVITPMCPTAISLRLVTRRHIASCLSAQS